MRGALLVTGTASDAGKSVVVAGLCRWLHRRGVSVAPFKAQNMALNSTVTADGGEIGRAQAMQAAAAGVAPEVAMNPILLKPTGERTTQVVVRGRAAGTEDACSYQGRKSELRAVALAGLGELRRRFDVVVCEGAGSPAEINLRAADLANMGLAGAADLPTIVVGDIDRGGVFAALYGTLALLEPADQRLIAGFVINKFRGDAAVLAPGLDQLLRLTGRPTIGVLPWVDGLWLDVEDSLALEDRTGDDDVGASRSLGPDGIDVAVVRLPRMSNFTDFDALACEPGVTVRFTRSPADVARADLAILPGSKATVNDLGWLRARGLDEVLAGRAARGQPVLGVCGGYQMLGSSIVDDVECHTGRVPGLGLLPVDTVFAPGKVLAQRRGTSLRFADAPVGGYEIRHGRVRPAGGEPLIHADDGRPDGCAVGTVAGTSWHGLLESDAFRRALLTWVAEARGLRFVPGSTPFAAVRDARLDALGDLVADHLDTALLADVVARAATPGWGAELPVVPPAGVREPGEVAAHPPGRERIREVPA